MNGEQGTTHGDAHEHGDVHADEHDNEQADGHAHGHADGHARRAAGQGAEAGAASFGDPWWAGFGAVGGVLLVVLGIGMAALVFLGAVEEPDDLPLLHGAAKVLSVGCVVAGTTLLARRRGGKDTAPGAEDEEHGPA